MPEQVQPLDPSAIVRWSRRLLASWLGLVLYVTLEPFVFVAPRLQIAWFHSVPDLVMNTALFFPIGLLGAGAAAGRRVLRVISIACALSIAIELMQTMAPERGTSLGDVVANSSGAVLGSMTYFALSWFLHRWSEPLARNAEAIFFGAALWLYGLIPYADAKRVETALYRLKRNLPERNPLGLDIPEIILGGLFAMALRRRLGLFRGGLAALISVMALEFLRHPILFRDVDSKRVGLGLVAVLIGLFGGRLSSVVALAVPVAAGFHWSSHVVEWFPKIGPADVVSAVRVGILFVIAGHGARRLGSATEWALGAFVLLATCAATVVWMREMALPTPLTLAPFALAFALGWDLSAGKVT